jgi:hypothetical protein
MLMSLLACLETLELETREDEALLVQATHFTTEFVAVLDYLRIDWEFIEGCPWIQFEIPSNQLQALIRAFSGMKFEVLE